MKKIIFSILLMVVAGAFSCRKTDTYPDIKQYDEEQIQAFIAANGLTDMQRDDSGIYYKVLKAGTGTPLQYSDSVGFVYTLNTFDGRFSSTDTITNHYGGYLGRVSQADFPLALQTAIYELVKNKGGRIRLLIPSHLGYGSSGIGSGSSTTSTTRIYGNQCLDYYINVMNDQPADNQNTYDETVISNYISANNLTGYTRMESGIYYKILRPPVSTTPVTDNSTIVCNYTFLLLNGYTFSYDSNASLEVPEIIAGLRQVFKAHASTGINMSIIMPSYLAYGGRGISSQKVPANSCVRFDTQVLNITP